jgi:hypothetical protein
MPVASPIERMQRMGMMGEAGKQGRGYQWKQVTKMIRTTTRPELKTLDVEDVYV